MRPFTPLFVLSIALAVAWTPPAFAQNEDEADKKTLKKILQEIELVPSLYAKDASPVNVKTLPKFSSVKLVGYPLGKVQTPEKEREKWLKDKSQYAIENPHRAFIFEAAETTAKQNLPMKLQHPLGPKEKAKFLQEQAPLGISIFQFEGALASLREADENRNKEKMRRWLVNTDFAHARVLGNMIFLYEYNFTLGQIRADNLPELGKGEDGWKITVLPKINVTEPRAKGLVKVRAKLLTKIQEENAGTPWAYFAELESKRDLGMQWVAKKK